jgi:hypothetical protein
MHEKLKNFDGHPNDAQDHRADLDMTTIQMYSLTSGGRSSDATTVKDVPNVVASTLNVFVTHLASDLCIKGRSSDFSYDELVRKTS